jgi:hypothetical protein
MNASVVAAAKMMATMASSRQTWGLAATAAAARSRALQAIPYRCPQWTYMPGMMHLIASWTVGALGIIPHKGYDAPGARKFTGSDELLCRQLVEL